MPEAGSFMRPAYYFHHWFWIGMDWLYPASCGGCGKPGQRWCMTCQGEVSLLGDTVCPRCGTPQVKKGLCQNCQTSPPIYEALGSWGVYGGPLRQAIHRLKYDRDLGLGEIFSRFLTQYLLETRWPINLILPVPLSPHRVKERGYNQADLLARPVSQALGIAYNNNGLRKIKETPSQVGLNHQEREMNVIGAFMAVPKLVNGANVLIIDDVTTTGATIGASAKALLEAGANGVWGLTLARAVFQSIEGYKMV